MVITFGTHKGKEVEDIPSSYLRWMLDNLDERDHYDLMHEAELELESRDKFGGHI